MDEIIKIGIVDYMNLMFGMGDETRDFWSNLILPYASSYYTFPIEELVNHYKTHYEGD
jgi:hypothetical protein